MNINNKLEQLRKDYKKETDPDLRKIIAGRGKLLKWSIEKRKKNKYIAEAKNIFNS